MPVRHTLDLNAYSEVVCLSYFRCFTKKQIVIIAAELDVWYTPNRLVDMEGLFGLNETTISVIFNQMADLLMHQYQEGSPLHNVVGFIDGTMRSIARPVRKLHGLKYQAIVKPEVSRQVCVVLKLDLFMTRMLHPTAQC
ncbi:hypothetical protein BD770DRAFT_447514 [Pilaira anomala]|nr:hypothetical protein BD770DRAFT_447514 [Pilaira anomala]